MNCEFSSTKGTVVGTYFRRNLLNPIDLVYFYKENITVRASYTNRLVCEGNMKNFTVTLNNLHESDIDIYYCIFGIRNNKVSDYSGQGTMLIVSEPNMEHCADVCANCKTVSYQDPVVIGVIVAAIVALSCALVLSLWRAKKICHREQPKRGRAPNSVYEDMNLLRTQSMAR
ncbi:uncharacterized protein [Heterodontus francisci]